MASENETVAEIVSKVRSGDYGCAKCGDLCDCPNADKIIASIAGRIEAAYKRDVKELRDCLEEAVHTVCFDCDNQDENGCSVCHMKCAVHKWRKALEGETK